MEFSIWGFSFGLSASFVSLLMLSTAALAGDAAFINLAANIFLGCLAVTAVLGVVMFFEIDTAIYNYIKSLIDYSKNAQHTKEKNKFYIDEYRKLFSKEQLKELEKAMDLNKMVDNKISEDKKSINDKSTISNSSTLFTKPPAASLVQTNDDLIPGLTK